MILEAGHNVILDAAFLKVTDRAMAISIATDLALTMHIARGHCADRILRDRIRQRSLRRDDASEASLEVLELQLATAEPLTNEEKTIAISCENGGEIDIDTLAAQVLRQG